MTTETTKPPIVAERMYDKHGKRLAKKDVLPDMSNVASVQRDYTMSLDQMEEFLKDYKS
jgi:hypothetical protein